ncbi:MAG: hypothetical protein WCL51_13815 [Bacteroidota bacterium]
MKTNNSPENLFDKVLKKATLKQDVYSNTLNSFKLFKESVIEITEEFKKQLSPDEKRISFEYKDKGEFEFEMKFAGDVLIFVMHTNIFEFSRNHEVMRTSYIKEDNERSYCGVINIYNFLADSFKYNRENDLGYLIGRIFVNKEKHYFIEGKRELGWLYNNFPTSVINKENAHDIIEKAIEYTISFDLLTPPYDAVKEVTVYDMQTSIDNMPISTGKRLGFKFQADQDGIK